MGKEVMMTGEQKRLLFVLAGVVCIVWCCGLALVLPGSKQASVGTVVPVIPTATSGPVLRFISGVKCRHDSIGNDVVSGTVENVGGRDLRLVWVRGTVYDEWGEVVNTSTSPIDSDVLYVGATATYDVYVADPGRRGVRCKAGVESYQEVR